MNGCTFASFVPDASSELAWSAARAVAERPGEVHNPLFLHGPCGTGKSHLLQAIEQVLRARRPDAKVARLATDTFVRRLVDAFRTNAPHESFDALLLDDCAFSNGHDRTQEEVSRRLQELVERGAAVVVSSHVPLDAFIANLRRFFESGLVAELRYPGLEARVEIARRAALAHRITLSDEALRRIAETSAGSARELQSAVARIAAEALL